jgi:hypothetical protein
MSGRADTLIGAAAKRLAAGTWEGMDMIVSSFASRRRQLAFLGLSAMLAAGAFAAGVAYAAQPHMHAALRMLQNASGELQAAEADKAGHRVAAIKLVSDAINEVQAGIAAGM